MDDRTFDQTTAQAWIQAVEKPGKSFRDEHVYPTLSRLLRQTGAGTILDIGCGQGICSEGIKLENCRYTGIEPSPFLLERARRLYPGRDFQMGSVYALPVESHRFDAVFSVLVWHLLSEIDAAAAELSRVLSQGGSFLIVTANPGAYPVWQAFYPDAKLVGKRLEGTMQLGDALSRDVLYLHTWDDLRNSLQRAGLRIESEEAFLPAKDAPETKKLLSIQGKKAN